MQRSNRAKVIIQAVQSSGKLTVDQLARLTGASEVTIRRDLAALAAHGAVARVPGGAARTTRSEEDLPYPLQLQEDADRKASLARAAAELVEDRSSVIVDNGTTCHAAARELAGRPLTAICLSLHSAAVLGSSPGARVVVPGGPVSTDSLAMAGNEAVDALRNLAADVFLLGACAVSPQRGLTADQPEDAATKRAGIESSTRRILLATADKLSRTSTFRFGRLADLTDLVTTDDAPAALLDAFREEGIQVLTV